MNNAPIQQASNMTIKIFVIAYQRYFEIHRNPITFDNNNDNVHMSHGQQSTSQASLVNILFLRSGWCQPDAHPPSAQPPSAQPPSAQPPSAHPPYAHSSCAQLPCVYTHLVHTHFVHTHPPCTQK